MRRTPQDLYSVLYTGHRHLRFDAFLRESQVFLFPNRRAAVHAQFSLRRVRT